MNCTIASWSVKFPFNDNFNLLRVIWARLFEVGIDSWMPATSVTSSFPIKVIKRIRKKIKSIIFHSLLSSIPLNLGSRILVIVSCWVCSKNTNTFVSFHLANHHSNKNNDPKSGKSARIQMCRFSKVLSQNVCRTILNEWLSGKWRKVGESRMRRNHKLGSDERIEKRKRPKKKKKERAFNSSNESELKLRKCKRYPRIETTFHFCIFKLCKELSITFEREQFKDIWRLWSGPVKVATFVERCKDEKGSFSNSSKTETNFKETRRAQKKRGSKVNKWMRGRQDSVRYGVCFCQQERVRWGSQREDKFTFSALRPFLTLLWLGWFFVFQSHSRTRHHNTNNRFQ